MTFAGGNRWKGLDSGSGINDFLRLIVAALVESSIYFSCIVAFPVNGLGIGGLKQIPLNFTMKRNPPSHVPAPKPPGSCLGSDWTFWYLSTNDRFVK